MITDVIIVGGGPNGLLLACELALGGVHPVLLEQLSERATWPKANGLVGKVVEALDHRGLYELFSGSAAAPVPSPYFQFGALPLDMSALSGLSLYTMPIPQRRMEELLQQRAIDLGVEIRRGHAVTELTQTSDRVSLAVAGPNGTYELTAMYLVGADGGHSTVRKACGIGFPGITDSGLVGRTGQVSIDPPVAVPGSGELNVPGVGRLRPGTFTRTETGMFAYGMFRQGLYRVVAYEWGSADWGSGALADRTEINLDELRDAIGRVLGADLPIGPPADGIAMAATRSVGLNSRQAERYREGRVFLLGDAAHVHSGIGGPGLNLGMLDALNLGWKLAAAVRGWAPGGLLDSYQQERYPLGERVIMHTRSQTAIISPGPNISALRQLFGELLEDPNNVRRISDLMAGSDTDYDMQPVRPTHPLVGHWMPNLELRTAGGTTRLAILLRTGRPVLLDLTGRLDLSESAAGWRDRVDIVSATADNPPADAILVRPDGHVAWAAGPDSTGSVNDLPLALATWFGQPVDAPTSAGTMMGQR